MGVLTVARSEIKQQLKSKSLLISLATTTVIIIGLVLLPQALDTTDTFTVGITGDAAPGYAASLDAVAEQSVAEVETSSLTEEEGRAALADGTLDALVLADAQVVVQEELPDELEPILALAHESEALARGLADLGMSSAEIERLLSPAPLQVTSVDGADEHQGMREGLAFIVMMLLLFLFMSSTVGLATSIVEEKSSRIVEILLVPLRPWQLLSGKLISFGVVGGVQLVVVTVVGLTTAQVSGVADDLPPGTTTILLVTMVSYLAGYLLFGAMAAGLAARVTRQEETNNALTPMTLATVGAYVGAYVATLNPGTTLATALTVLPPVAPISIPVQYASGTLTVPQFVAGAVLTVVAVVAMVWVAGRIYERSVLRTGDRVSLREALTSADPAAPRDERPDEASIDNQDPSSNEEDSWQRTSTPARR